jgi:hypothetical protein
MDVVESDGQYTVSIVLQYLQLSIYLLRYLRQTNIVLQYLVPSRRERINVLTIYNEYRVSMRIGSNL